MDDLILKRISSLIADHSGLCVRPQDFQLLSEKVWRRAKALGLRSLEDYHSYLLKTAPHLEARSEWRELYSILTINESYFFRDSNQIKLLSDRLLPDIIQRQQAAAPLGSKPRLGIWSAGCSTGEELYSIAIALDQLNFPWAQWDVRLIGTDISPTAIHSAREGLYGSWSFRQTSAALQQQYFQPHRQGYKICDRLRQRVIFQYGNLLHDPCPRASDGSWAIDLILCRNVFIYLDHGAIGQILQKFHRALVPQGYLLTGHTELHGQDTSQFQIISCPGSVVYQKPPAPKPLPEPLPSVRPASPVSVPKRAVVSPPPTPSGALAPSDDASLEQALQEAAALLKQDAYSSAIAAAKRLYLTHPRCATARKIAAQAYANIGSYSQAKQLCQQVIQAAPLSLDMHYLLAQIAEDENDLATAKEHLRKIIYLDPEFVKAYLDLASIYDRIKQPEKASTARDHALTLLAKLPPGALLDDQSEVTVAQWQEHLNRRRLPNGS
ncbi:CheR family methyltransferase [Nodosilinea sp. PGN35]|uniref:CheR family methyltransferase n=1 Tax=Nodosilinea sp. PGN35 TaxID=3020489 RepID=UPI0023B34FBA|nr:CheR family methyltransferase [Nodosilinea sp. TSF1-S3]MDF0369454.1 hypothetical protein [Nodosilinea sp. TSF1-S3]